MLDWEKELELVGWLVGWIYLNGFDLVFVLGYFFGGGCLLMYVTIDELLNFTCLFQRLILWSRQIDMDIEFKEVTGTGDTHLYRWYLESWIWVRAPNEWEKRTVGIKGKGRREDLNTLRYLGQTRHAKKAEE